VAASALSTSPPGTASHEDRGEKNAYDFFDLNVRGTFEVFEAAASLGVDKIIFISTTSVYRPDTLYGRSKILAELIAEDYRAPRHMNVVTLRPRGFIPHWDRDVYARIERTIDEVARAIGRDPVEVRIENMISPEQMPYASIGRMHYDSGDYPASVRLCADLLGMPAIRKRQRHGEPDGRLIGIGFASFTEQSAGGAAEYAARDCGPKPNGFTSTH
jgi:hypothetical protein